MDKTLSLIKALKSTNSRNDKEQLLMDAFMNGERNFFIGAQLCYDPLISFGVAKVASISTFDDDMGTFSFEDFLALVSKLRKRELTGHAARDAIHAAAEACHVETWNLFYRRILLKDLDAGVEEKTINKVLGKVSSSFPGENYSIPVFSCQLAHDGMKPEHEKKLKGRKYGDVKLDGVRLLTVLDKENNTVTQYTRNGKENGNFVEIRQALSNLLPLIPGSLVLDGEVVSTSFNDLMTQVNRREKVDTTNTKLALFDIIPLNDFKAGVCKKTQTERHNILTVMHDNGLFQTHTNGLCYVIPKVSFDLSTEEGYNAFLKFNREALDAGYEGVMLKDPHAPYECKRSVAWLKIKPFIEVSLEIVGFEEGTGKYSGQLGALVFRGEDDGRQIEVNVGGGLTDAQRIDFWNRRDELLGMIGEVRADAFSKERNSEVWSLRFPRFKGMRGTKPGEKL